VQHEKLTAEIGVFGGSGFYEFLTDVTEALVETPYGAPSDKVAIATIEGRRVAFLPRHGRGHTHPAHVVNYRANVWALHSLGVRQIIGPCAVGSLQRDVHPGDFVVLDQFVDRTSGRDDTFFNGPVTHHITAAEPYCPRLRALAMDVATEQGIRVHSKGAAVIIQGPRFSTRAESAWFTANGWTVVGMTQYPEAILAKELGICYTGIALVTDYDAGIVAESGESVNVDQVLKTLAENNERVKDLILTMIARAPACVAEDACLCAREAEWAVMNGA
jgi:5'-methylthioadenosine phosphorylase